MLDTPIWNDTTYFSTPRHTLSEYELEPLLEMLCEENQAPISYRYVYIDADGKLACFDLVRRTYEVRPTGDVRERLLGEAAE